MPNLKSEEQKCVRNWILCARSPINVGSWALGGESFLKLLLSLGWSGLSRWGLVNGQIRDTVKFLLFLSGMQSSLYYYVNIITWHSFKVTFPVFLACMYIGLHCVAGNRMLRFVCIAVKIDTYEEYGRRKHRQKVNVYLISQVLVWYYSISMLWKLFHSWTNRKHLLLLLFYSLDPPPRYLSTVEPGWLKPDNSGNWLTQTQLSGPSHSVTNLLCITNIFMHANRIWDDILPIHTESTVTILGKFRWQLVNPYWVCPVIYLSRMFPCYGQCYHNPS